MSEFLTQLDVINDMMSTLGETPLASIDDDHPFVAAGLQFLKTANNREQAKGWWFNTERVTLSPDAATGFIMVPNDALSIDPMDGSNYVQRGRRLYNPRTQSYIFTQPITCKLIRKIPFEDLPPSAASYIGLSAVLLFQRNYDADTNKTRDIGREVGDAYITFNSEQIRNVNANLMLSRSMLTKLHSLGMTPQLGPAWIDPN